VSTTTGDFEDLIATEGIHQSWGSDFLCVFAVTELAIDTLAPGENLATRGEGSHVVLATRDLIHTLALKALDETGLTQAVALAAPVSVTELAIPTVTPGENLTSGSECSRVVLATRHLNDMLALQSLDKVRHAWAAPVTMAQLAITATTP
jgi:hypothetical protein